MTPFIIFTYTVWNKAYFQTLEWPHVVPSKNHRVVTLENIEYPITRKEYPKMVTALEKDFQAARRQFVERMISSLKSSDLDFPVTSSLHLRHIYHGQGGETSLPITLPLPCPTRAPEE